EGGLVLPGAGELRHHAQRGEEFSTQQLQAPPHQYQISVVRYESAGGTEVDERLGCGRRVSERVHVCHHIVPEATLVSCYSVEVYVIQMSAHLVDRLERDVDPQLPLRLRERQPEPPPQTVALARRPELEHGPGCVAFSERGGIAVGRGRTHLQ